MTTAYKRKPTRRNKTTRPARIRETLTIPYAHALSETGKALRCDFGDNNDHWVPKSQITTASEVRRSGDHGRLVVTKWWAEAACVMEFALAPSPWARLPHLRKRLEALDLCLAADHPARLILKTVCDALREDLGIKPQSEKDSTTTPGAEAERDGGSSNDGNQK